MEGLQRTERGRTRKGERISRRLSSSNLTISEEQNGDGEEGLT